MQVPRRVVVSLLALLVLAGAVTSVRGAWCGGPFWWHLLGTITLLGLTGSALKGWRPAPYVALVVLSLGIGFASPPRWVNQAASFVVLLPPVMALIFGSRRAVALSGIGTVAVLVARGGEASPYLDFEFVVPFVTIVAGMVLARGVIESMLRSAYKEALRATAEHARAEVERERAEQEGGRAAQSLSELAVARQSLTEQEERYRLIAENSGDLVVLFDRYHRVVYASPASRAVLGRDPDDLLGRELKEIVAEQDVAFVDPGARRDPSGDADGTLMVRALHRDRTTRWLEVRTNRVRFRGEDLILFVARDATRRRELEARLSVSQRLESVGRLAGGVAHDFNNVLTVVSAHVSLLDSMLPEEHPGHRGIGEMREAIDRATALTRQLFAFARRQVLERRCVDLNDVIRDVAMLLKRLLGTDVELELKLTTVPALVRVDVTQIEQVLMNLATNARDAMPRGGRLRIETDAPNFGQEPTTDQMSAPKSEQIEHSRAAETVVVGEGALPAEPSVRLTVIDSGEGMDEATQRQAFEPFFSTKAPGERVGFGLAACYGIVHQHGGAITIESSPGRGARFDVYLPAYIAEARPSGTVEVGSDSGTMGVTARTAG